MKHLGYSFQTTSHLNIYIHYKYDVDQRRILETRENRYQLLLTNEHKAKKALYPIANVNRMLTLIFEHHTLAIRF